MRIVLILIRAGLRHRDDAIVELIRAQFLDRGENRYSERRAFFTEDGERGVPDIGYTLVGQILRKADPVVFFKHAEYSLRNGNGTVAADSENRVIVFVLGAEPFAGGHVEMNYVVITGNQPPVIGMILLTVAVRVAGEGAADLV